MPLVNMRQLLAQAKQKKCAIGSFSVGSLEMVMGAVKAAETMNTPILLQIAEVRMPHAPLALIGPMMLGTAKAAKVDIGVHLDHGITFPVIQQALDLGFTSVMFDGSSLPYQENLSGTQTTVEMARTFNAAVESELGTLGKGEDGSYIGEASFTDPDIAAEFSRSGIDALAVSVGNAHGNYKHTPKLRFDVMEKIRELTDIPMVLHGGTGITPEDFRRCIDCGVRKINIATATFDAVTMGAKEYLQNTTNPNYFGLNEAMVEKTYENVCWHIRIFNNEEEL